MKNLLATAAVLLLAATAAAQGVYVDSEGMLRSEFTQERAVIVEANSPENRLRQLDYGMLDRLWELGANTVYFSTFGGDDHSVHPWVGASWDRADKSVYDEAKLARWQDWARHWVAKGGILHVVLQETENDRVLDGGNMGPLRTAYLDRMWQLFAPLPYEFGRGGVIFCLGEENRQSAAQVRAMADHLHALDPLCVVSLHTWPGEYSRYDALLGTGAINMLAFQAGEGQIGGLERTYHQRGMASGAPWAVYASEDTRGNSQSGMPPDSWGGEQVAINWLWAGWPYTSGAGIYGGYNNDGCDDLYCPNPELYARCYASLAASARAIEAGGAKAAGVARLLGAKTALTAGTDRIADAADVLP